MNFGGLPMEMVERSMRLFAAEVMPALRGEPATAAVAVDRFADASRVA